MKHLVVIWERMHGGGVIRDKRQSVSSTAGEGRCSILAFHVHVYKHGSSPLSAPPGNPYRVDLVNQPGSFLWFEPRELRVSSTPDHSMTHSLHTHRLLPRPIRDISVSTIDGSFVIFTSAILSRVDRVFCLTSDSLVPSQRFLFMFSHLINACSKLPFTLYFLSFSGIYMIQLCHRPVSFPILSPGVLA